MTFNSMLPTYAQCLRDGVFKETQVRELVKGDILLVRAGDVVPADMRIIESKGFKVRYIDLFYQIFTMYTTIDI